ncbi:DddA-like double-stranded DNA deaminase toxin [Micromonospora sp. NPDC003197]
MSALAEVAATIRAKVADLNAVAAALYTARAKLDQAQRRLAAVAYGAGRHEVTDAATTLSGAAGRADEAATLTLRAAEALAYYSTTIIGVPLSAAGGTSTEQSANLPFAPVVPEWVHHVGEGICQLLPRSNKTVGVLATADGRTRSKPMWSGTHGPAAGAPGLRRDDKINQWHRLKSAVEHVEGHAAAVMRRPSGPKDAVLVLSAPPCPGPYGCSTILPELLPANSRLSVYVMGADGRVRFWRTYVGTGEGTTG